MHRNDLRVILTLFQRLYQPPELCVFLYYLLFIPDKERPISSAEVSWNKYGANISC